MALVNDTDNVRHALRCDGKLVGARKPFISQTVVRGGGGQHRCVGSCSKEVACGLSEQRNRGYICYCYLSLRGSFCTSFFVLFTCSREAACFLGIREKSPKYYEEGGNASRDLFEWGMCHVDVLLCCGCSCSSCLSLFSLMFLLRIQRGLW